MTTLRAIILITPFMIACVPTHNVRPLPNFVETAIESGDKVWVTWEPATAYGLALTGVNP